MEAYYLFPEVKRTNLRVRRIYRTGKSVAITLPPDWLRGNDLGPGDEVEIRYDGEIHIRPKRREGETDE